MKRSLTVLVLLLATGLLAWMPSTARAVDCFPQPWKCCDSNGYNWPKTFLTQNKCVQAGGTVACGLCPNQPGIGVPYKCCDSSGAPVAGVFTRSTCASSGYVVYDNVLTCPNSGPFECCDPVGGGSAPGLPYVFRSSCVNDGYVVQDFAFGCPGGLVEQFREWWQEEGIRMRCLFEIKNTYMDDNNPNLDGKQTVLGGWQKAYNTANGIVTKNAQGDYVPEGVPPWPAGPDPWNDKDTHCVTSCLLTVECNKRTAQLGGWGRETAQLCDGEENNAWGSGDECANKLGRDFGETLRPMYGTAAEAETACKDYCTGMQDLTQVCPPNGFLSTVVPAIADSGVINVLSTSFSISDSLPEIPLFGLLGVVARRCFNGIESGLTYPTGDTVADILFDVKQLGADLISAASTVLAVGDTGTIEGGSILHRHGETAYALAINLPSAEVDAYIDYEDGTVKGFKLRGANGETVTMQTADPIETACATPSCKRRVPWTQWVRQRENTAPFFTSDTATEAP